MHTDPVQWARIRKLVLIDGQSIRGVARSQRLSRAVVRKMLAQEQPAKYRRPSRPPAIAPYVPTITSMLIEDEAKPQRERRTMKAIYESLRDQHGSLGSYDAVRRQCRKAQSSYVKIAVRPFGFDASDACVAFAQGSRAYRLKADAAAAGSTIALSLERDRRAEQGLEVAHWINELRGNHLGTPLRVSAEVASKLLPCVHDPSSRRRNRAITVLAYAQGFPIRRISACLGLSRNSCRRHIRAFQAGGVEQLLAPISRGVLKAQQEDLKAAVFRILHEPPKDHGINRTSWTMRDLRMVLTSVGHPACLHVVRQIVKDAGWKWRKARIVLTSQDPAYREKLAAVQTILGKLASDEAFFSIDEFGPFAVKMKSGVKLDPPGPHRVVPQWQRSKGCMIMTAALELSGNQVTHFYSERKNTAEMIRMMEVLIEQYADRRTLYLSWDAASWHMSKKLHQRIQDHNAIAEVARRPRVETAPLPAGAQFLNVIESIFSGMARATIHNSNYESVDEARAAINSYFAERNQHFREHPKRAGKRIWGEERSEATFSDSNNCKDPRWR